MTGLMWLVNVMLKEIWKLGNDLYPRKWVGEKGWYFVGKDE